MAKKNLKKIFIGLGFILMAAVSGLAAFYYFEVKPELASRGKSGISPLPRGPSAQTTKRTSPQPPEKKIVPVTPKPPVQTPEIKKETSKPPERMQTERLVEVAESVYDEAEKNRREGYVWIDRQTSTYVVTLGALHGLKPGDILPIYDKETLIGHVTIDSVLDVISYVHPQESADVFSRDYYRVTLE